MDIPAPYEPPHVDCYYPEIEVQLVGENGNAWSILSRVQRAMKREGVHPDELDLFMEEAMSGDYNYLLQTCEQWVTCL